MYTLAAETGGKSFLDSNDIAMGIQRTQEAMGSYYLLGYYSSNNARDGKYRKISVKLNNSKLAAKLEHREGYYADKVWGKLNAQDKEQQLKEALSAGDPATDLPLALQIDYFRVSPTAYLVPVSIKIPGSVVALAAKGGAATTQFDFAGQIQDEARRWWATCAITSRSSSIRATRRAAGARVFSTMPASRWSRAYRMKFVVRENITGKMGTFETSFTIPDLSADTTGLEAQHGDLEQPAGTGEGRGGGGEEATRKEVAANPLIVGDQKVVPNITQVFPGAQNVREFRRVRCAARSEDESRA